MTETRGGKNPTNLSLGETLQNFIDAVMKNNVNEVIAILAKLDSASIKEVLTKFDGNRTACHCAARYDSYDVLVELLLILPELRNERDVAGRIPHEVATKKTKSYELLSIIQKASFDDSNQIALVKNAAKKVERGIVKLAEAEERYKNRLIRNKEREQAEKEAQVKLDARMEPEAKKLHEQKEAAYLELVKVKKPSDILNSGEIMLHEACANGYLTVVKYLAETALAAITAKYGEISEADKFERLRARLINKYNAKGYAAIHIAADIGYLSIIKYLVNTLGVDPNLRNKPETPLFFVELRHWGKDMRDFLNYGDQSAASLTVADDHKHQSLLPPIGSDNDSTPTTSNSASPVIEKDNKAKPSKAGMYQSPSSPIAQVLTGARNTVDNKRH